jgi:hypothetical protein
MTATQSVEVVYGQSNEMRVVMNGTEALLDSTFSVLNVCPLRWKGIN